MRRWIAAAAFLAGAAAGQSPAQDAAVPRAGAPSGAIVARASGEVVRFVAEPAFRALVLGQDLLGGDLVRTGPAGAVGILFVDRTVMRLHPNTELLVNAVAGGEADLTLLQGTLWARAPRGEADLRIATPTAAAAIRGTDWAMSVAGDGTTQITVYDGAVELANELGAVLAVAGEAALAAPGRPPVKIGVANRAELPQMLFTLAPADAVDPVADVAEDLAGGASTDAGLAAYGEGLRLMRAGSYGEAARAYEHAAPGLVGERRAAARWLAAFARAEMGAPFRAPPPSGTAVDRVGSAVEAALRGDLAATASGLARVQGSPAALAAAVEVAIVRDDGAAAAALVDRLKRVAPGSVPALAAEAAFRADVLGDATTATRLLERAVTIAPDRADLWNDLGLARDARDHPIEAERAFRRALALAPGHRAAAANLAILLLDTERVAEARALAAEILAADPGSYLGLRAEGRAALQSGEPGARDAILRALAAQPAAAETSILLAIAAHQEGEPARAAQELDAAARLDPNDPIVPLLRSIMALDQGRADAAIAAAQEAARLYRRQDGSARLVAADRETGSPLAAAFLAIGLDGWARSVADRTYDPLSAASLFGEATLLRPGIGRGGPGASGGEAALLQGLLLDPLGASYRLRMTDILRQPFVDAELGHTIGFGDAETQATTFALQGFHRLPMPLSFAASLARGDAEATGEEAEDSFTSGSLLLGTQAGARLGGFAVLGFDDGESQRLSGLFPDVPDLDANTREGKSIVLGGSYRLSERNFLSAFFSAASLDEEERVRRLVPTETGGFALLDSDQREEGEGLFLGLGYRGEDISGVWYGGLEAARLRSRTEGVVFTASLPDDPLDPSDDPTLTPVDLEAERHLTRAYLGRRQRLGPTLEAEGFLIWDDTEEESGLGARAAIGWSFAPGQWLRAGVFDETAFGATSLMPVSTVGLVPLRLPSESTAAARGWVLRWDGDFGRRLHLGAEHQELRFENVTYETAEPLFSLGVPEARLSATSLRADYWVGGGVGLFGSATRAESEMEGTAIWDDGPLPETPEWTLRVGAGWLHPSQLRASVEAVWTSGRFSGDPDERLDPVLTVDAGLSWEPLDKRLALRVDAVNLFDAEVEQPWGEESTGRQVAISAAIRF